MVINVVSEVVNMNIVIMVRWIEKWIFCLSFWKVDISIYVFFCNVLFVNNISLYNMYILIILYYK